jgi:hypothetical protein
MSALPRGFLMLFHERPVRRGDNSQEDCGIPPFFGNLSVDDVLLDNPTACIQGDRVTHLVSP